MILRVAAFDDEEGLSWRGVAREVRSAEWAARERRGSLASQADRRVGGVPLIERVGPEASVGIEAGGDGSEREPSRFCRRQERGSRNPRTDGRLAQKRFRHAAVRSCEAVRRGVRRIAVAAVDDPERIRRVERSLHAKRQRGRRGGR